MAVFHSAPELLNGIFIPQSDLFSIGAVLYHLLFGVPPFFNENILNQPINKQKGLLESARNKPLNFSLADDDLIDEQIKNTLTKALSIEIEDRFQTADDFSKALKREMLIEKNDIQKTLKPYPKIFNKILRETGLTKEIITEEMFVSSLIPEGELSNLLFPKLKPWRTGLKTDILEKSMRLVNIFKTDSSIKSLLSLISILLSITRTLSKNESIRGLASVISSKSSMYLL